VKLLYVLHADFEQPGAIVPWAAARGFQQSYCHPFKGERLPKARDFDLLILMGGPQSPLELDQAPYLKDEIALVADAVKHGIPTLGFCLGAQIIGEAFGGRTSRSPHREIGVFPIQLTPAGQADPLLAGLPSAFPVSHWHNDMPGGGEVLATSEGCPRQIVRYNQRTYGFQCHPEMTVESIQMMLAHCEADLKPGPYVQTAAQLLSNDYATINRHMTHILDQWLLCSSPIASLI
jgi:GMP synthase (glutamine-hydrolysing)